MVLLFLALATLTPQPGRSPAQEAGFTPLFDGQSLAGWVTKGGRYDGHADWSVQEGCIVGKQGANGEGGLLYTAKRYTSFELRLETKLDHPFDSGVFLRMAPEKKGAQVTLDWREGGEIGAIYSDGFLQHNEAGAAKFRADDWNDVRVRCTGFDMHIQVWLNGEQITDFHDAPADPFEYAPTGLIGIQVHGERGDTGVARFRNLRVRELPLFADDFWDGFEAPDADALTITRGASERGWRALFDGSSLAGWTVEGEKERYRTENGVLAFLATGGGGQLMTTEDYTDFELRLDFRTARMANSGLFLRAARDGSNAAFSGCELQILDDANWESVTGTKLKPWQLTGSLYGSVPAGAHGVLRPLGQWNSYEVLYRGARLAVALNGLTLYDVDTATLHPEEGAPFARRARTGFIGLQHHGSEHVAPGEMAAFRKLFLRKR